MVEEEGQAVTAQAWGYESMRGSQLCRWVPQQPRSPHGSWLLTRAAHSGCRASLCQRLHLLATSSQLGPGA